MSNTREEKRLEARARRAARALGYCIKKSRQRLYVPNIDNHGQYMVVHAEGNVVVAGSRFDMTAEDVLAWCATE